MSTTIPRFRSARRLHVLPSLLLVLLVGGCGWHSGPVGSGVSWQVGEVSGASVEPGVQASARGALARALVQRGAEGSEASVALEILQVRHTPSQASASGQLGWVTEAQVRLSVASCDAEASAEQRWSAPEASSVVASRAQAVDGALEVAIGLALDRLLVQEDCA